MSLRYLLDTSTVSAAMARAPDQGIVRRLRRDGASCAIPAPAWHELLYGIDRLPPGSRRDALEDYARSVVETSFPVLPYDQVAATWHARERARLERAGRTPPFVDGQIAAIAFSNDLDLVTTNIRHFTPFTRIRSIDWSRA